MKLFINIILLVIVIFFIFFIAGLIVKGLKSVFKNSSCIIEKIFLILITSFITIIIILRGIDFFRTTLKFLKYQGFVKGFLVQQITISITAFILTQIVTMLYLTFNLFAKIENENIIFNSLAFPITLLKLYYIIPFVCLIINFVM